MSKKFSKQVSEEIKLKFDDVNLQLTQLQVYLARVQLQDFPKSMDKDLCLDIKKAFNGFQDFCANQRVLLNLIKTQLL